MNNKKQKSEDMIKKDSDLYHNEHFIVAKGIVADSLYIKTPKPVGYLVNENIKTNIPVYKEFNFIQRFFIKFCFGLKFVKTKLI